jgi:flagellar hook protein FlgE
VVNVRMRHDTTGVTQFSDPTGNAQLTNLAQNGFPAGELVGVSVSDAGRVVASYSNGQVQDIAVVAVATFNGDAMLRKLDGGAFLATRESGDAILVDASSVIGGALEMSNVDISDEFTKLIVTQQAYSASTRVVSVSDEMMQEALGMVR